MYLLDRYVVWYEMTFSVFLYGSKYVFSPTITIVTKEATVMLTATESDYERSMRQHDLWYNCLKNKLHFGNFYQTVFITP